MYFYDFMIFANHLMQIVTQELAYCITWFLCCQISVKKYEIFTSKKDNRPIMFHYANIFNKV